MGERRRRHRLALRAALVATMVAAGGGCTARAGAPPPAPSVPPLSAPEIETVTALLGMEDTRAFSEPLLREATASSSARVRRHAALTLGRLLRPEGAPLLLPLLADPDTAVAATAAFSLGQLGDTAAVPALLPLLADSALAARPTVASEAAYALGKLRAARSRAALLDLLGRAPASAAGPVGSALLAVWRLPGPPETAPILRWAEAADPELRWRAAYALTRRPTPAATAALLSLAGDPDPRVRAYAVRGLTAPLADSSGVGAARVLPVLLEATGDSAYAVRIDAVRALGSYRDARAVERLAALVGEGGHTALAAVEALGGMGGAAAGAAPVLRALATPDSVPVGLREAALLALASVAPAEAVPVATGLAGAPEWRVRAGAARALSLAAGAGSEPLAALMRDGDGRVAAAALRAVLDLAGDSVAPLRGRLVEALGSEDVWTRATALEGLARLADPATLPLLLDAYQRAQADSAADAALAAIDALAALGDRGAPPQRAFFVRFPRSPGYLVRLRARERFGAAADSAWGDPLPIDLPRGAGEYRALVARWIAPSPADRPRPTVEILTDAGRIVLRLHAADAPLTVESLLSLAERGYFDGQEWPRVVPNFVVQGGDPRGDSNGGPGYALRDEINRHRYLAGSLGMALSGPDTGGSQFFVTHSAQPHLDGIYTLFGEVVEGREVAEAILPGDRIHTIRPVP